MVDVVGVNVKALTISGEPAVRLDLTHSYMQLSKVRILLIPTFVMLSIALYLSLQPIRTVFPAVR